MAAELNDVAMAYIANSVKNGECVLFLGAGAHCAPPEESGYVYEDEQRPPLGSTLSQRLAEVCGFAEKFPGESPSHLQRVSLCYEMQIGRKQLVEEIEAAVHTDKVPSPILCGLAELGFPVVITTNFDRLFERALAQANRDPWTSIYSPRAREITADYPSLLPTKDKPLVLKIHGDISEPASIVITDEDYIDFVLRMQDKELFNPVPTTVRLCLSKWTTLFVGYSLFDYNLRLLFKAVLWGLDKATRPVMYSVDIHPDPLILAVLQDQQRYVTFLAEDVWTFVPDLYRRVLDKEMHDLCA